MADNPSLWDDPSRGLDLVGLLPNAPESGQTDTYTLSLSYEDQRIMGLHLGNGAFRPAPAIRTEDGSLRWEKNAEGARKFVKGPWNPE